MIGKIINNFLISVSEVSKNWSEARRMKFSKETKEVMERLRDAQNALGAAYNDDVLALAEQDFVDYQVAFNLQVVEHNKEVGVA